MSEDTSQATDDSGTAKAKAQVDDAARSRQFPKPAGRWTDRVRFDDTPGGSGGAAHRPGQIMVVGDAQARAAIEVLKSVGVRTAEPIRLLGDINVIKVDRDVEIPRVIRDLAARGVTAEPNYVVFSHHLSDGASGSPCCGGNPCGGCACGGTGVGGSPVYASPVYASPVYASPVYASPVYASPVYASPVYASPVYASPVYASPVYASPVYASPVYASEYRSSGVRSSSARPAADPKLDVPAAIQGDHIVLVFDTGIAAEGHLPSSLSQHKANDPDDVDAPDTDGDHLLDPAAGHGTFIAGLLERTAPGLSCRAVGVLSSFGDGSVAAIAERLGEEIDANNVHERTVITMSFGAYADTEMHVLAAVIQAAQDRGAVVVASAGNDGICVPQYPAALPGVVGVGSIEAYGRAPYSNYGPWLRACAPGTDVISSFFTNFNGSELAEDDGVDPDDFKGWASWTGTSFAAPIVAAQLVSYMAATKSTAKQAVERLIDAPELYRFPNLGTVINTR